MSKELKKKSTPKKSKGNKSEKSSRQTLMVTNYCKNCESPMALDQQFCSRCGAKRIHNRLNARNLMEDFADRFLNIENQFFKTFICLFTKPEDVINGYINGIRKRYMSAFSYFAVALTLGSLYLFVFRNWFLDESVMSFGQGFNGVTQEGAPGFRIANPTQDPWLKDAIDTILDYQSIFSFLLIPLYALISKIVFLDYKKFNFIEHCVIYLYSYSQTQIIASVLGVLFVWSAIGQLAVSFVTGSLPFFYTLYVLYKVFDLSAGKLVLKTLLFFIIFGPIVVIFMGLVGWILYTLGMFDTIIEQIKLQSEAVKAAKEAAKVVKDTIDVDSLKPMAEKLKDTLQFFVP